MPQLETHESESACFSDRALQEIQNLIFLIKYFIFTTLFFLGGRGIDLYLTKSKNGFPIVFSNLAQNGSRVFFQGRKLIFLPNGLYLPTKQPWGSPKF